jgi:ligand-binding sensor domain-containing protein
MKQRNGWIAGLAIGSGALCASTGTAQDEAWLVLNPSNTGMPGELVSRAEFAPDGRLWVAARWLLWEEGGIGIYDLETGVWETYADWETPLPSEYIYDFAFDGEVAWIATDAGLARFDGSDWTIYNTGNAPFLNNWIAGISVAPNGDVWVNNTHPQQINGAILRFDGKSWTSFEVGDELPWDLPWAQLADVEVDASGHVWVSNYVLNGVAEFDGSTWTLHGENVNRFGHLMADSAGNVWLIAGVGGGNAFYKFDGSTFTTYTSANTPFVETTITTFAEEDDGSIYVGNWIGEIIKTTSAGSSWSYFSFQDALLWTLAPDPASDEVWMASQHTVRQIGSHGELIARFNTYNTGLPDYFLEDILGATDGTVWFASSEAGVTNYDGTIWENWGSHNPNKDWQVLADGAESLYKDAAGDIWFGTNGVARLDDGAVTLWDWRNSNLSVDLVNSFATDPNGDLWVGTDYTGAWRFDGSDWQLHLFGPYGWTVNEVQAMTTDAGGNLWVGTFTSLHRFDGQSWTEWDYDDFPLLMLGGVTALAPALDGGIWVGTNGGLNYFDGQTFTLYDDSNSPLPANEVQSIAIRDDGLMAVSSFEFGAITPFPNGVSIIDGDIDDGASWTVHTYDNSPLPHYQLGTVAFDGAGDLWVSPISEGVAKLTLGASCPADFNADGALNILDFVAFQNAFKAGDDAADANGDGTLNILDFVAFQGLFQAGC